MSDPGEYILRPARVEDAEAMARIMKEEVPWSRVKDLGPKFVALMHRSWITSKKYGVVVVIEHEGEAVAYGAGLSHYKKFHRYMVLRYGIQMALLLLPKFFNKTHRETLLRAYTYFPEAPKTDPVAELVAMNVSSRHRRAGLGRKVYNALMDGLKAKGVKTVKLGHVDPENPTANGFWLGVGGRFLRREKFYDHNEVNVYVYDIP